MGREIVYCGDCGRRLSEDEFDRGRAHFLENRPFCTDCRAPAFVPKKKHSTTHIPLPPLTPRRAMQTAGGAPPPRPPASKAPLWIGLSLGGVALLGILIAVASGGKAPAPKDVPKAAAAVEDLLPLIQDLEKFAASGADPETILTRCDRDRPRLRDSKFQERFLKVENAAKEKKSGRDQAARFDFALTDIRKVIASDTEFARHNETLERLKKAKELAGPRLAEVERILADYEAAYARRAALMKPVVLLPDAATRKGNTLHVAAEGDLRHLAGFNSKDNVAEWSAEIPRAGRYQVDLIYACDNQNGGEFTVSSGKESLKAKSTGTGGWSAWKPLAAGQIQLAAGTVTITLKPTKTTGGLMNLRSLTLTPLP